MAVRIKSGKAVDLKKEIPRILEWYKPGAIIDPEKVASRLTKKGIAASDREVLDIFGHFTDSGLVKLDFSKRKGCLVLRKV